MKIFNMLKSSTPPPETFSKQLYSIFCRCEVLTEAIQKPYAFSWIATLLQKSVSLARNDEKRGKFCLPFTVSCFLRPAFTLAEVLITLGIIGVVAAMTIPTLMNNINDAQYKTAYKKAYSDLSNASLNAIYDQSFTSRIDSTDTIATEAEFTMIKNAFKVSKECEPANLEDCWTPGEYLTPGAHQLPYINGAKSFIDTSGRAWAEYSFSENLYLVDTNGSKKPNQYGKDRWIFTFKNADNTRVITGLPAKVGSWFNKDITIADWTCHYPPCNYQSWLIGD